jgi:cysteinyl-tRNA synthetase
VKQGQPYAEREQLLYDLKSGFSSTMDDDLNISAALATIFAVVKKVNALVHKSQLQPQDASKIVDGFRSIDSVLKIFNFFDDYLNQDVQRLLRQRDKARSAQNWALADKIRDELKSRGISVEDQA